MQQLKVIADLGSSVVKIHCISGKTPFIAIEILLSKKLKIHDLLC